MSSTRRSGVSRRGKAEQPVTWRDAAESKPVAVRLCASGASCLIAVFLLAGGLLAGMGAGIAQPFEGERSSPQSIAEMPMDLLFDRLAASPSRPAARPYEAEILRRFHRSGSDTADLLLNWATEALADKEYSIALDLLDRLIILQPNFAEAWNQRATVHFMTDQYGKALSDIRRTLVLQPKHFGALAGLGVILDEIGRTQTAIEALRKALTIHPHMKNAEELLEKLEAKEAGQDT
jgi:tetratricopeptide (TPR) repeat protein